jgi:hypothetical protein
MIVAPVIALDAFVMFFVWVLHPCTTLPPVWAWWVAAIVMSGAFVGTVVIWLVTFGHCRRDQVIQGIEKGLLDEVASTGRVDPALVSDLQYLGGKGEPGEEKGFVLAALARVAEAVQARTTYVGDELGGLVMGIGDIMGAGQEFCLGLNLEAGREMVEEIWGRWTASPRGVDNDALAARAEIEKIATRALDNRQWSTFSRIVQASVCDAAMLRRLGVRAAARERDDLAVAALSRLETLVVNALPLIAPDDVANLLGLEAEVWSRGGSGVQRVTRFRRANPMFVVTFSRLDAAVDYFQDEPEFRTADLLRQHRANAAYGILPNLEMA